MFGEIDDNKVLLKFAKFDSHDTGAWLSFISSMYSWRECGEILLMYWKVKFKAVRVM